MLPKIVALCPTFNRFPKSRHLIEECVESFLRQDYLNSELFILNDTPNQNVVFNHSRVKIVNTETRFETLSDKLQYMIDNSDADLFCRWDDDDINLPWRLSLSVKKLGNKLEWRPENHWYMEGTRLSGETVGPANTHIMALWRREVLQSPSFHGVYPPKLSGGEDQKFNQLLNTKGEILPKCKIFYIYRWGVSPTHLSGIIDKNKTCQSHWDDIGKLRIQAGTFLIEPHWRQDYIKLAYDASVR